MPDPGQGATEELSEVEQFATEFHDAKFGNVRPESEKEQAAAPPEPSQPETVSTTAPVEPAGEPEPSTPETPQVKLYTVPDQEMYGALRGQRVTAAQLEEAGLIDKVITRDHQEMHNTKLYNDLKREFDQKLDERIKSVQPQVPQETVQRFDPKHFSDQLEATYVPVLKKLGEQGVIEEEFVEAYPKVAAQVAHMRQTSEMIGTGLIQAVQELATAYMETRQADATTQAEQYLEGAMEQIAASDPRLASLSNPEERRAFKDWMRDPENPQPWKRMKIVSELSQPKNLLGAYAAYVLDKNVKPSSAPVRVPSEETRRAKMATAGGGVSRTKANTDQAPNEIEQFARDLQEAQRAAFNR